MSIYFALAKSLSNNIDLFCCMRACGYRFSFSILFLMHSKLCSSSSSLRFEVRCGCEASIPLFLPCSFSSSLRLAKVKQLHADDHRDWLARRTSGERSTRTWSCIATNGLRSGCHSALRVTKRRRDQKQTAATNWKSVGAWVKDFQPPVLQ